MHVVSNDNSSDHIDDIVSADGSHHKPLIAHYEEHQIVHFEPFAGAVLQCHYEAGAYVP